MQCAASIIMLLTPVDAEMYRVANSKDFNAVLDVAVDEARKEIRMARGMATWQQRVRAVTLGLRIKSRRRNARLILLFKIVKNLLVLPNHCLPQPTPVSYTRANNPLKFAQLQSRIDLYKYSFLPRTIIDWNNLKIDNINTINLDTFKNIIDKLNNL